ncbi:MAG: dihydrofolate reductase family protein [Bacteriovorax sp.]
MPSVYLLKEKDDVQSLRQKHECVLVCMNTIAENDSSLMVEDDSYSAKLQPLRIVLGKLSKLNPGWKILTDAFRRNTMIVVTDEDLRNNPDIVQHLESQGISLLSTKSNADGNIDLNSVLRTLGSLKFKSILVEDTRELKNQFINMGLGN